MFEKMSKALTREDIAEIEANLGRPFQVSLKLKKQM